MKNLIIFLILMMCNSSIFAHGPTRQKVSEKIIINASVDKVWSVIKDFHHMNWHPMVQETKGSGDNLLGSTRILILESGGVIEELLEKYDEVEMKYFYRIINVDVDVLPVSNYSSWVMVKAKDKNTSEVIWKGAFYRGYPNNDPPEALSDKAAKKAITKMYQSGLNALKKAIEN